MLGACSVRLLGGFEVEADGRMVPAQAWRHRRGADLVKLLALQPSHQLHREQLADALWPGLEPAAAAANLRKAIHFARRALGSNQAIEADSGLVRLWPGGSLTVDVERFELAARAALEYGRDFEVAAGLCHGELLPADRFVEWTEPRREYIRDLCLRLWRAAGRWELVLEVDRSDEEAHRALMRRSLETGDRRAALRQFSRLRDVLRIDLGVAPDEETMALFEEAVARPPRAALIPADRAQEQLARGLMAWSRGDINAAEHAGEEALQLALQHRLGRELGEASTLLGMTAFARGRWRERFRTEFERALGLGPEQAARIFDANVCLAETTLGSAEAPAVAELARELLSAADRAASTHGRALSALLLGEAESAAGGIDDAYGWLRLALNLAERARSASGEALALVRLAEVDILRGERAAARRLLARAMPVAQASELAPHLVTRVFAARVNAEDGEEQVLSTLDEADRGLHPRAVCGPCSIGLRVSAAIACAKYGDLSRARRCLAAAEALAGMWQGGPWRAATWEARAALRVAEGDSTAALGLLREASDLFTESGRRLDAERCRQSADRLRAFANA